MESERHPGDEKAPSQPPEKRQLPTETTENDDQLEPQQKVLKIGDKNLPNGIGDASCSKSESVFNGSVNEIGKTSHSTNNLGLAVTKVLNETADMLTKDASRGKGDSEQFPEDPVVTVDEFVADVTNSTDYDEDDDADVAAVLGGSSESECSYPKGYVKRQALYSCLTCAAKSKEIAGICLACCFECHDGHDLVEMYTKRNFRCDCGNSKFSGLACKLCPDKDVLNEKNQYNQNFEGKYCVCHRPHPDPELNDKVQVQCVICEDWFHLEHVLKNNDPKDIHDKLNIPRTMICKDCCLKHPFFNYYVMEETDEHFVFEPTSPSCQIDGCALKFLKAKYPDVKEAEEAAWTRIDWYEAICTCETCRAMYVADKIDFLLDKEDSTAVYEEKGREVVAAREAEEQQSALENLMSGLPHIAQIEFADGVATLKTELNAFLTGMAARGEVVTGQAIADFFQNLREKHKQDMERRMRGLPPSSG